MTESKRAKEFKAWLNTYPPELNPLLHDSGEKRIPCNEWWADSVDPALQWTVSASVSPCFWGYNHTAVLRIMFAGNDDYALYQDVPLTLDNFREWNAWLSGLSFISSDTLFGLGFDVF